MEYGIIEIWGTGGPPVEAIQLNNVEVQKQHIIYTPECRALQQCKNEIDLFYREGKWDDYKKITNPYEYIFLSWNRRTSRSVATRSPLSRSYFKMIEMWKRLDLSNFLKPLVDKHGGFLSAHAAEGPGGFIEACSVLCEKTQWKFKSATAITLRSEAKNVPGWRKAVKFLETNPQVKIHDGADGTGNILSIENQDAYVTNVRTNYPEGVHVFTADGGFDFSSDFNAQEDTIFPLLLAESIIGLRVLAKGGILIIKCFDTTEQPTLDLIWLISRSFCEWAVMKPATSRAGNAERYIIGKGFIGKQADIMDTLLNYQKAAFFTKPIINPINSQNYKQFITSLFTLQERIEHVEIKVIRETLDLIRHTDAAQIRKLVKSNVERSIKWCLTHDEPVANTWLEDQDFQVNKEANDLIYILHPPTSTVSYGAGSWYSNRSTISNNLSFAGFRSPKQDTKNEQ